MEGFLGKELEVLMEEEVEIDGVRYWTGHTREYLRVAVLSEENLMNQMVHVTPARIHGKGFFIGSAVCTASSPAIA